MYRLFRRYAAPFVMRSTVPRWGFGSFFVAWIGGLVAGVIGAATVFAVARPESGENHMGATLVGFTTQTSVTVLLVWMASSRRGTGRMRVDFGLGLRGRDWWWVLVGAATQIGIGIALAPLTMLADDATQGVVETFREASDDTLVIAFAVCVVVLAPLAEELLFRGLLLRTLMRRTTPGWAVVISASVFAGVHVLLDPSVGTAVVLPGLMFLGLLAGDRAVRTGSLSQPILLHAGFNLLTALFIVLS